MEPLRLSGLATGMDTASIIEQLMMIERRPIALMKQKQALIQKKDNIYQALNTKLSSLQSASQALMGVGGLFSTSPLAAKKAASSDETVLKATATSAANVGTYDLNITQLAMAQKTGDGAFTSPAAAGTIRITKNSDATFKDIAIAAGATVQQVADSINGANGGMTASVLNGKLLLTGKETGESFTVDDGDATNDFAASLGIDSATKTYQAAQSASVTIDGRFTITSKTNTFTDLLPGVTVNALKTGTSTLTISQDLGASVGKVKELVDKYNEVINHIKSNTKYNAETKTAATLTGDPFMADLTTKLNRMLTEVVDPASPYKRVSDIGIEVTREGTITLNETKLNAALSADPNAVFKLFSNEDSQTYTDANGATVKKNNFGDTGAGTVGDGAANRLSAYVDQLIASASQYNSTDSSGARYAGALKSRMEGFDNTVDRYNDQIANYERRMELREKALRAQFVAMEKNISTIRNQGNYMMSMLASLPGVGG